MKKNILILVHAFDVGGIQKINTQVINGIDKDRFNVHVLYVREGVFYKNININDVKISKLGNKLTLKSPRNIIYILKIIIYIIKNKIDIVHSMDQVFYGLASISSKLTCISHIRTQPNFISRHEKLNYKTLKYTPFQKWTDKFITLNEASKEDLIKAGISNRKVISIYGYGALDEYLFPNKINNIKEELKIPQKNKIITAMHRMVNNKGYETFIDSIPLILQKYKDVSFLLVGDGPKKTEYESRAKRLGVDKHTYFLGFRNDIVSIAHQSTFGIYPLADTAAMVTLLRSGKIIITKRNSAMDEYVIHNVNGLLVDEDKPESYAKYAVSLLEDESLLDRLEKSQKRFTHEYLDGKKNIKKFEEIIIKLLEGKNEK